MRNELHIFGLLFVGLLSRQAVGQSADSQLTSLCELQTKIAQGEHRTVRVQGVYLSGLEGQYLVTAGCSGRSTHVEFDLRSHHLWKRLVKLSNKTSVREQASGDGDPILVVFSGEFYGSPVPDPKLPEAIRKNYHPGWDHMNASMTKMIVHGVQSAEPLPSGHPCALLKGNQGQWPCFQNPAPARSANPTGDNGLSHELGHAQGSSEP